MSNELLQVLNYIKEGQEEITMENEIQWEEQRSKLIQRFDSLTNGKFLICQYSNGILQMISRQDIDNLFSLKQNFRVTIAKSLPKALRKIAAVNALESYLDKQCCRNQMTHEHIKTNSKEEDQQMANRQEEEEKKSKPTLFNNKIHDSISQEPSFRIEPSEIQLKCNETKLINLTEYLERDSTMDKSDHSLNYGLKKFLTESHSSSNLYIPQNQSWNPENSRNHQQDHRNEESKYFEDQVMKDHSQEIESKPNIYRHQVIEQVQKYIRNNVKQVKKDLKNLSDDQVVIHQYVRKSQGVLSNKLSKYRGVKRNFYQFQASIGYLRQTQYLGTRPTEAEAAILYDKAAIQVFGLKAKTNFSYTKEHVMKIINSDILITNYR